jgi:hypothetical protein
MNILKACLGSGVGLMGLSYFSWQYTKKPDPHNINSFKNFCSDYAQDTVDKVKHIFTNTPMSDHEIDVMYSPQELNKEVWDLALNGKQIVDRAFHYKYGNTWYLKKIWTRFWNPKYFLLNNSACGTNALAVAYTINSVYQKYYCKTSFSKVQEINEVVRLIKEDGHGYFFIELNNDHLPNQVTLNHILVIEKINKNRFRIYQSFVNKYHLVEYLLKNKNREYSQREILRFIDNVEVLTRQGKWDQESEQICYNVLLVPHQITGPKRPEDQWHFHALYVKADKI